MPDNPIYWLALLISITGGLLTMLHAAEKFLEMLNVDLTVLRPYGGLALPVSWVVWSFLLLYWRFETATVLIVLLGTLVITGAAATLYRRCQA